MTTPNAQYRGPGGFMSTPGLDRSVLSTHVNPLGIDQFLPASPTTVTNPLFPIFTGVTDEIGNEPDNVCDDAPTALLTSAYLTAQFGRIIRDTPTIDRGRLPQTIAGEPTDLTLLAARGRQGSMDIDLSPESILTDATRGAMFALGVQFQRKLNKMYWQGNTAVNNPAKPGYLEFPGLDRQVATGQVDAQSGSAVAALDSYVKTANYASIGTYNIVANLQDMERVLYHRALNMFGDATFVIAMRPEMWEEITGVWPIQYSTQSVTNLLNTTGVSVNVDGNAIVTSRDMMRAALQITLNGRTYPVVLDHGIYLHDSTNTAGLAAGSYASTIYMLPLTVYGGFPVLRIEYLDFTKGMANIPGLSGREDFWTDGGRYLWSIVQDATCFHLKARVEPRIVLQAPFLAGKIERVAFAPMSMDRQPDPSDPYFVDGGVSIRPQTALNAIWK